MEQIAHWVHWGVEAWLRGRSTFLLTIGDGSDAFLTRITGSVTASPFGSCSWSPWMRRQSLVSLHCGNVPPTLASTTAIKSGAPGQFNVETDPALFMANPKVVGLNSVVIPINQVFEPAVRVKGGILKMLIDTDGPYDPVTEDKNALNTEVHIVLQWQ